MRTAPDAIVIGAGPNGLAAALVLAKAGRSVRIYESANGVGGGMRSAELTLPGFTHDVCSTVQGTSLASPFFSSLDLTRRGLEYVHPTFPLAHPFDDGTSAILERSVEATASRLGVDGLRYERLVGPLERRAQHLMAAILGPPSRWRHEPALVGRFGLSAVQSAMGLARRHFRGEAAAALFAGMAAHGMVNLERPGTASFGLVLAVIAHTNGWPVIRGGTENLATVLATELRTLGGEIVLEHPVTTLDELPPSRAVLFDTGPGAMARIAGDRLPVAYRRRLARFRYGPGIVKVDWALDGPIPWRSEAVRSAGTVHLGGTMAEIAAAEATVDAGRHPVRPFVLLVQATMFDPSRAPKGAHTGWAYCHVPNGSTMNMTERIEAQVERFAPGFRDRIIGRSVRLPQDVERHDANFVGGDINGGVQDWRQMFARPVARWDPYSTPNPGIFLCSAATPPGGGVHGMSGFWAARSVLRGSLR